VRSHELVIEACPGELRGAPRLLREFGQPVSRCSRPYSELSVRGKSVVEIKHRGPWAEPAASAPWELGAHDARCTTRGAPFESASEFSYPSRYVEDERARSRPMPLVSFTPGRPLVEGRG